jgi:predicted nucleic acid-binding protein
MLLDTCIVIDLLRRNKAAAAFLKTMAEPPSLSVISLTELIAGAKSRKEERVIEKVVATLRVLPVTEEVGRRAGEWVKHYGASHSVDIPDALIAATAEHHRLPLATLNLKHFPMFPKLKAPY